MRVLRGSAALPTLALGLPASRIMRPPNFSCSKLSSVWHFTWWLSDVCTLRSRKVEMKVKREMSEKFKADDR